MRRPLIALLCLGLLGAVLSVGQALAEDEDSPSSVYLVFDAETGEFVEVDDPNRQRKHVADQEAIVSGTTPGDRDDSGSSARRPAIAVGVAVAAVLLFAALWLHRSRREAP